MSNLEDLGTYASPAQMRFAVNVIRSTKFNDKYDSDASATVQKWLEEAARLAEIEEERERFKPEVAATAKKLHLQLGMPVDVAVERALLNYKLEAL
jgi:hypothetical protein